MEQALATAGKAPDRRPERARPSSVAALIAQLEGRYGARISGRLSEPPRPARYADMPAGLDPRLVAALAGRGIARLYSHQREA
ncbi:MAG: hypothetical protein V3R72_12315, partial [Gammaproteobacteria bacterium]